IGADTALARAAQLVPECSTEIQRYRTVSAQALLQAGTGVMEARPAEAREAFMLAARINPAEPRTWYVAAGMEEAAGKTDSALAFYKRAYIVSPDPADQYANLAVARVADLYESSGRVDSAVAWYSIMAERAAGNADLLARARMSMGRLLYNAKRYPDAIVVFRQYLADRPDDADAKRFIALAYDASGQPDSAKAIRATLGMASGVAAAGDTTNSAFLINRGAGRYRAGDKAAAAADFALALEREPGNRIAARNLLSVYNELNNGEGLVAVATRLLELEPLSESARRYQVQGYLYLEDREGAGRAVDAMDAMPVSVEDVKLVPAGNGATLTAVVTGREVPGGPASPVNLVVEFLDAGGGVVTTEAVTLPALPAGGIHQLSVNATGGGIVAFRYRQT
ncbi:MAG: tetratricopeptide repeat protein, partial [Gemmatimonadales bacterium]